MNTFLHEVMRLKSPAFLACVVWLGLLPQAFSLDLTKAVVVSSPNLSGPEKKAVAMLIEEVEKRTQIRWANTSTWPSSDQPVVVVGPISLLNSVAGNYASEFSANRQPRVAEGFQIQIKTGKGAPAVFVIGNDAREIGRASCRERV